MGNAPHKSSSNIPQVVSKIVSGYWPLLLAGAIFITLQWPIIKNWWGIWNENESYYSHGVLVPFIAAFMLWTKRGQLARTDIRPSWLGLLLLLLFVPIYAIGLLMELRVVYGVAFFVCIFGIMLAMLGSRMTRIAFIPTAFLSTMMPVASWVLDAATARFQLVSATVATKFLQLTSGHDVSQYGNTIYSPSLPGAQTLLVGSPCSGLRLLISLITFSWFFIYVIKGAWWKKAILMGLSFPLSIFINSLRITMIGYVGFWTGSSAAMHTFHDYSGYIGLVICFVILFGVAKLLRTGDLYMGDPVVCDGGEMAKSRQRPVGAGICGILTIAILIGGAVFGNSVKPLYDLPKGHIDRNSIPKSFGGWTCTQLPIDDKTRETLSMGDLLSLMYVNLDTGRQVQVFMDAAYDTSAFHDPHLCLPGGGSPVTKDQLTTITFDKPKPTTLKASRLVASGDYGNALLMYWYTLGNKYMPRTADVTKVNRANKMDDFRRIVSSPWTLSQLRRDVKLRQFVWYRFSTDSFDENTDEQFLKDFIKEFVANTKGFGKL